MKTDLSFCHSGKRPCRAGERGWATLIVLALLTIMVTLMVANSLTLHHLNQELRLIEQRQLQFQSHAQSRAL
jgi:hypothetical protein